MRCGRIGSRATWPRMIRTLRPKRPISSACICIRRSTRRCSASMRRRRSKRSIARTRCCRLRQDEPNGMALSITATARCPYMQPLIPRRARSWERPPARHTSAEFVAFLTDIVANQPRGKEIHVIADNLSAHKSQPVKAFLENHSKVHLHFTPTYSSWLNQVELWFAKIERDVIARGVFTSLPDLKRKLMRYIRHYNQTPKTVKWKYFDPTRRITSQSAVTGH